MTVVWLLIAIVTVIVHVAGSKLEALDGQNVTIPLKSKLERVDEVKVIFEGENKGKLPFAHYCFRETDPVCDVKSDHLQVEGRNVSLILLNVNSSRTGLYRVRAFCGKEVDDEVTATLVVKPPISSSAAPPQTSTSKPPNYSEYQEQLITAVIISCVIIISVLAFPYFWKQWRVLSFQNQKDCKPLHTENV